MGRPWYKNVWAFRKTLIIVLTPLVWLPIAILYSSKAGRCAYSIAILATYWMTEAIPIAATALLPIFLFPWLGVLGSKPLCKNYLMDTNFLFFSGLLIAVAVEKWNLHKRIALKVLTIVGCKPQWLLFGFMVTTSFLSMWLSNTATAAMLMPIAFAVLNEMHRNRKQSCADDEDGIMAHFNVPAEGHKLHPLENGHLDNGDHTIPINDDSSLEEKSGNSIDITVVKKRHRHPSLSDKMEEEFYWLSAGMKIGIAVAANIGGTATLTGTGPNIVLKGQVDKLYGSDTGLNFSSWFLFAFPNMVICLIFAWIWMSVYFLGFRRTFTLRRKNTPREEAAYLIVQNEYKKLGTITFAEVLVASLFTLLAVLWFTRQPGFMPGWGALPFFEEGYITDACTGMTIAVLLFFLPAERPKFLCCRSDNIDEDPRPSPALLDWETVHSKMAWSVVVVLGGTFALADACKQSGLSEDVGRLFQDFSALQPWILVLVLCLVTGILTNITSNTATATIFLPVVGALAANIGLNPFYLMIPVAVTASFAFMLPVGTPPNAIVFAYGQTKIMEMFKSGIVINIVTIFILQFSINTFGYKMFNLGEFPAWAVDGTVTNSTVGPSLLNSTISSLNATAGELSQYDTNV